VSPGDLKAPVVKYEAPRQIAPGEAVELSAPKAFQGYVETGAVQYADQSTSSAQLTSDTMGVARQFADVAIDFDPAGGEYSGGGGLGGTAGVPGTVPCMESSYVDEYLRTVKSRTESRWNVPPGVPLGAKVVLRFELDASGSATRVSADGAEHPDFGASAVQALREASPFPAMSDAVRCLDGKRLNATFIYEDRS
jgi:TonB family protein